MGNRVGTNVITTKELDQCVEKYGWMQQADPGFQSYSENPRTNDSFWAPSALVPPKHVRHLWTCVWCKSWLWLNPASMKNLRFTFLDTQFAPAAICGNSQCLKQFTQYADHRSPKQQREYVLSQQDLLCIFPRTLLLLCLDYL